MLSTITGLLSTLTTKDRAIIMIEECVSSSRGLGEDIGDRILDVLLTHDLPSKYIPLISGWVRHAADVRRLAEEDRRYYKRNREAESRERKRLSRVVDKLRDDIDFQRS